MIALNCIFLSSYFILSVHFTTIESTKKISPTYYVSRTYSRSYVDTVNNVKTYNERELKFTEREITILTNPAQTYNDIKGREEVFDKFDAKIQDIKCTCSLIVKTKLVLLTNILEGLRSGGAIEVAMDKLIALKKEAGLMVLLFRKGIGKAGKWFWSYFLKIVAIIDYEDNKNFFGDTNPPFGGEEFQSGIADFIQQCKAKKYLPKSITDSALVAKNPNVPNNIFRELRTSISMAIDYFMIECIPIEHFYLKQLWYHHELLFAQITGSAVEWKPTIERHAVEVHKTKEYVENRQWISQPFGHLNYHKMIKQIITVRTYIFLWVTFVIFNKEMPKMNADSLKIVHARTIDTINKGHGFMSYTDTFFSDIQAMFNCVMHEVPINFDSIIARISVTVKDILVKLNGRNSNGTDWISINVNEEFSNDMIMKFLQEFSDNFNLLRDNVAPLKYELALSLLNEGN